MYTPLYVKTNYSLLSSLITIDDYIKYGKIHNIKSLAIADNNMFACMEFYKKCINNDIKPIIGLELNIDNSILVVYAKDYIGYQTLIKLSTIQELRKVEIDDIKTYHNNIIGVVPFIYNDLYNSLFNIIEDLYIGYSNKQEERDASLFCKRIVFFRKNLYIEESDKEFLKYLYMIRDGKTILDDTNYIVDDYYLDIPDIYLYTSNENLFNTDRIASKCNLEFPKSELLLPIYSETNGLSSFDYLKELSSFGLNKRLNGMVRESYINRLNYELDIINKMGFSNYFLVVYDFIRYAKKNKILVGPGRGSGAGSLVCYSLGITDIDPLKYDLLFERFLNPERVTMPDIDTDFPDKYRDQVINYVVDKYGKKRVSGIVTFGTLAAKQALRDTARVLNIPSYQVDLVTKRIPTFTKLKLSDFYNNDKEFASIIDSDSKLKLMFKVASFIEGYPRHTSSHAAGIIMSKKDLDEVIPLTISDGMYLSGYTMEYLEELGLLKMDFLGLKTLTTIMNIISDIKKNEGVDIDFNKIPLDDKNVLELFSKALTVGIFQFESEGMKNFLRKLKPNSFEDIFAAIALFRPGPADNIDTYIRRKYGKEKIDYIDPSLEPILKNTYGIIIYQEQIMQIAVKLANYSLGEADILRRAMSKKKKDILIKEEEKFIYRSCENGYSREVAKKVYDLILKFAGYGFNRSHSVAYSMVAYKMAYLKYYYPKYFYASLLSSVIGATIKESDYIREAKISGISILKPDINKSGVNYTVSKEGIYYPITGINGIGSIIGKQIVDNKNGTYTDIFDFLIKNSNVNKKVLESLIMAGCFDSFKLTRKTLMENLDELLNYQELVSTLDKDFVLKPELENMQEYTNDELIGIEKELFGFYLSNHPVANYKAKFDNIISLEEVPNYFNKDINCVVLVEKVKTINTKKGDTMMFLDGSDEYLKRDFTLFPKIYQKYKNIRVGDIVKISGKVERRYDAYQIIVDTIEKLN